MKKVTALLGDYWHQEEPLKKGLENAITPIKDKLTISYIKYEDFPDLLEDQPNLIIISKENRLNPQNETIQTWMTPEIGQALNDYVKSGGSILAWHSGLAEYAADGEYIAMLRGRFEYHPPGLQQVTYYHKTESFSLGDEQYFVQCQTENTEVFLTSSSAEGESIAGWQHLHGNGRVCCFTPAHTQEALFDLNVSHLLLEKIKWYLE